MQEKTAQNSISQTPHATTKTAAQNQTPAQNQPQTTAPAQSAPPPPAKSAPARAHKLARRLANAPATPQTLAAEFGVSEKTIRRWFGELARQSGGAAFRDGRLLCYNPALASDGLGSDERAVLGVINQLAKASGAEFYRKAQPLLARLSQHLDAPVFIAQQSETLGAADLASFTRLQRAIAARREVAFEFRGHEFIVRPCKLVHFDGLWYLAAFHGDLFKKFYFKDVQNVRELASNFTLDERVEARLKTAQSAWFGLGEPFFVSLGIAPMLARHFRRLRVQGAEIFDDADGGLRLELWVTHIREVKPLIYRYIPHIRVIEPQTLADEIKRELGEFVATL